MAPYLGIGYDFSAFGKVGLNLDIGVLWQGDPDVTLTADGLLASDPTFLASLETERQALRGELKWLERRWRDAEEIAEIADNLFVTSETEPIGEKLPL